MPDRLNVLWIQTDELRADALGCYGDSPWAAPKTPNLDALAARGAMFRNTYCNSPVCVASRTSMLSGRYPHELGIYHNEACKNGHQLPENLVSFPQAFAAAGYKTCSIGKTHTPKFPFWQDEQHPPLHPPKGYAALMDRPDAESERMVQLPGAPRLIMGGIYPLAEGEITPSTNLTNEAMDWLEAESGDGEPWMLRVSFVHPHTPVMPPKRFADMFDPNDFAVDPEKDRPHDGMSAYERLIADARNTSGLTDEQIAYARSDYWGLVSHVDDEVGRLLERLKALGQEGNTIVVFDSDHGTLLAEMGLWQKQMFNRAIHRVPQIISCPGSLPEGESRDDLNELLDRAATLMGLCDLERPEGFRGRDLFGDEPEPEAVYGVIGYGEPGSIVYPLAQSGPVAPRRVCARTRDYRYSASIRYDGKEIPAGDPERAPSLIDIANDLEERNNVSGNAEFAEAESRMEELLEEWLEMDGAACE